VPIEWVPEDAGTAADIDPEPPGRSRAGRETLEAFLHPEVIAVVGAGSDPRTLSGLLFGNLVESGFAGTILPVNKKHATVHGLAAYTDLASCPVRPDLVVVCVPAAAVAPVVAEAGALGVKAVCVLSAGFAELGPEGSELQRGLLERAAATGVHLVGPNCTGILGGSGVRRFNATFSRRLPPPGRTALLSQSGAIGVAILDAAEDRGLGVSSFVSVGNCADIDGNDLLEYWGDDGETELILAYLESVPDAARFARIARRVSRSVPIVVVKAGRTEAGRRGATSHTAALSSGDAAVDALLRQSGTIRAGSLEEMLDLAALLGGGRRRFKGRRVGIVTNGGGPGVLAADACEASGLTVPELGRPTRSQLRSRLPAEASVANPVDIIAGATAEQYGRVMRTLGTEPGIDAVMVVYNTPLVTTADEVAGEMIATRGEIPPDVALLGVFMVRDGPPRVLRAAGIPAFTYPENAARALDRAIAWYERQRRPGGIAIEPHVDLARAHELVIAAHPRTSEGWMDPVDAIGLVEAYGIHVPRTRVVSTPAEAAEAQADLRCAVVVKACAPIHKTDVGAVRMRIADPTAAADAVIAIRADLEAAGQTAAGARLLVQEQVEDGLEMIVGVRRDPLLGHVVVVGLGGTLVEVLEDVAVGVSPLADCDIDDMLESLKSHRLFGGYRGMPPRDVEALREVLRRVSALADDVPEIAEMDLNPVFVLEKGAVAADVRVRLVYGRQELQELQEVWRWSSASLRSTSPTT
jgi:acetate---CoA ligase (ADP-forming)